MEQASDLKIAQEAELWPVQSVAEAAGIPERALECYGRYKAKVKSESSDFKQYTAGYSLQYPLQGL